MSVDCLYQPGIVSVVHELLPSHGLGNGAFGFRPHGGKKQLSTGFADDLEEEEEQFSARALTRVSS